MCFQLTKHDVAEETVYMAAYRVSICLLTCLQGDKAHQFAEAITCAQVCLSTYSMHSNCTTGLTFTNYPCGLLSTAPPHTSIQHSN